MKLSLLPRGLTGRTIVLVSSAFFFFLAIFFLVSYYSITRSLTARADGEVRHALSRVAQELALAPNTSTLPAIISRHNAIGESSLRLIIFTDSGAAMRRIFPTVDDLPLLDSLALHSRQARTVGDGEVRFVRIQSHGYILGALYGIRPIQEANESMVEVFAWCLGIGLLLAVLLGWSLSRLIVFPVTSLANAAEEIIGTERAGTLPASQRVREISLLATSINKLLHERERTVEQLQRFAADAAHELRTPLTVLRGEIEVELSVLQSRPSTADLEEQRALLESNLEEIERLIATVQDLLELSEIEHEAEHDVGQARCSVQSAMRTAIQLTSRIAAEHDVLLELTDVDIMISVREDHLVRMLYNLVLNAILHSGRPCTVRLRCTMSDSAGVISVEDGGVGIAADVLPHLFERFYRQRANDNGTGLGLAIVKAVSDRYGMPLAIESTIGIGTTVRIELPRRLIVT